MGFKRPNTIYKLVWPPDHDNYGLEVRIKSLSIEELTKVGGMADVDVQSGGTEAMDSLDEMIGLFASKLVDWNLEDDEGQVVPCTFAGVKSQDMDFVLQMVDAWMTAAAGVVRPLPTTSSAGKSQLEGSIPMEPLSESLVS